MTRLLLITTLVSAYWYYAAGERQCSPEDGKCVPVHKCSILTRLLSKPKDREYYNKFHCGYEDNVPMMCCPSQLCTTPHGTQGACIASESCPHLLDILSNHTPEEIYCKGPETDSICCSLPETTKVSTKKPEQPGECQLTATPPDPNSDCCGYDAHTGPRIHGGTATAIDEYPWLALMEYRLDDQIYTWCGGALISGQYVLTAAHCIGEYGVGYKTPVSVRLGEHNTTNFGRDCVTVAGGGQDCADKIVSVSIEKTIKHDDYNRNQLKHHDIALVKLVRIVQYTEFIRPICLPSDDFTLTWPEREILYAAGWGATESEPRSDVKLKVGLPYVSAQDCWENYRNRYNMDIWEGQICAGGESGKDSCNGDSGGPLMQRINNRHEVVGLVSFGPTPCGIEDRPAVYTKIFTYLPWIRSHIDG